MSSYLSERAGFHALRKDIAAQPEPRTTTRVLVFASNEGFAWSGLDACKLAAPSDCMMLRKI